MIDFHFWLVTGDEKIGEINQVIVPFSNQKIP